MIVYSVVSRLNFFISGCRQVIGKICLILKDPSLSRTSWWCIFVCEAKHLFYFSFINTTPPSTPPTARSHPLPNHHKTHTIIFFSLDNVKRVLSLLGSYHFGAITSVPTLFPLHSPSRYFHFPLRLSTFCLGPSPPYSSISRPPPAHYP